MAKRGMGRRRHGLSRPSVFFRSAAADPRVVGWTLRPHEFGPFVAAAWPALRPWSARPVQRRRPSRNCSRLPSGSSNLAAWPQGQSRTSGGTKVPACRFSVPVEVEDARGRMPVPHRHQERAGRPARGARAARLQPRASPCSAGRPRRARSAARPACASGRFTSARAAAGRSDAAARAASADRFRSARPSRAARRGGRNRAPSCLSGCACANRRRLRSAA